MICEECGSEEAVAPSHSFPAWVCTDCGHTQSLPGMEGCLDCSDEVCEVE